MLWIFINISRSNWHDVPTNCLTVYRLIILWSNFFKGFLVLMFLVDSHTLLPILYPFLTSFLCWSMATAYFSWLQAIFFFTNFHTFSILAAIDLVLLLTSCSRVNFFDRSTRLKLILGIYLRITWNGSNLMNADRFALAANLAIDSMSTQLFWKWLTYTRRCLSISWLAILLWLLVLG